MNKIQFFQSEQFGPIRTMTDEQGEPWFVGKDVAVALGYQNPSNSLQIHVDEEDKTSYLIQVSGSNYKAKTLFINESGLYSLILSSKLESAKAFKRWVTSEVLPQIRKTGGYIPTHDAEGRQLSPQELLARADEIIGRTLRLLNAPGDQCLTATEVAAQWGLQGADFNRLLHCMGIQERRGGRWHLAPELEGMGLTEQRIFVYYSLHGRRRNRQYMVWTKAGVDYLFQRFRAIPRNTAQIVHLTVNYKTAHGV